jgi:hypothetical protein
MSKTYNSLTVYLNAAFVDESKNASETIQINEGTGGSGLLGGWLASFSTLLGGIKKSDSKANNKNPLMAQYAEIAKKEAADAKKRIQNEMKAEQDMEIQKLKTMYEHNRRQLDLKSQQRVAAYNALKKQLQDAEKRASNTKLILTANQNASFINRVNSLASEAGLDNGAYKRMATLTTLIGTEKGEDGKITPLSQEEIKQKIEDIKNKGESARTPEEKTYLAQVEEYNKLAKENEKQLIEDMSSEEFQNEFATTQKESLDSNDADNNLKEAKAKKAEYDKNVKAIALAKDLQSKYDTAKEKSEKANTAFEEYTKKDDDGNPVNPLAAGYNPDKGTVDKLNVEDLKTALKTAAIYNGCEKEGKEGELDPDKVTKKLKELGFSTAVIDKIVSVETLSVADLGTIVDAVEDDAIEKCAETVQAKVQQKIGKLKADKERLAAELEQTVDIKSLNLDDDDSDETKAEAKKTAINKALGKLSDEDRVILKAYTEIPATDRNGGTYDPASDAGKDMKKSVDEAVSKAQEVVDKISANQEALLRIRSQAETDNEEQTATKLDDKILKQVDDKVQGIEAGEIICTEEGKNKGKIGFYDDKDNFVPKPDGTSETAEKEYLEKRRKHVLALDLDSIDSSVVSVKPGENGKYIVIIKGANGKTEEKNNVSEEDAINYAAKKKAASVARTDALKHKQDTAEAVKSIIGSDGKIDKEKYKALYDAAHKSDAKAEDIAKFHSVRYVLEHPDDLDTIFNGVDMIGKDTAESIKKIAADNEAEIDLDKEDEDTNSDEDDKEVNDKIDAEDDDEDAETDKETGKKVLKHPSQVWKRRTGKGPDGKPRKLKSYCRKDNEEVIISQREYKEKLRRYKEKKQGGQGEGGQTDNSSLNATLATLLEHRNNTGKTIKYTELRNRLLEMFN